MSKIVLNGFRNNLSIEGITLRHDEMLDQPLLTTSDVTFSSLHVQDLYATGNILFTGNITEIDTSHVNLRDDIININVDNDVPILVGGIRIQRGANLTPFDIFYNEASQTLRIGFEDNLQAVATREDLPVDNQVAVWSASHHRFEARNTFDVPLTFRQNISAQNGVTYGTGALISGDASGNLNVSSGNNGSIVLGSDPSNTVIKIPQGRRLEFGSTSNLYTDSFGNLVFDSPKLIFPVSSKLAWGGLADIFASNSGNDLSIDGSVIQITPLSLLNINSAVPIKHGTVGQLSINNGDWTLSSTKNLVLNAAAGSFVTVSALAIANGISGQGTQLLTDVSGNLSVNSTGEMILNPNATVKLNLGKSLSFATTTPNSTVSLSLLSNTELTLQNTLGSITLTPRTQVYIPAQIPLNMGSNSTLVEAADGTTTLSSLGNIAIRPAQSVLLPDSRNLQFGSGQNISGTGSTLNLTAASFIYLRAPLGVGVDINVPFQFGDSAHRIYQTSGKHLSIESDHEIQLVATERVHITGKILSLSSGALIYQDDLDGSLTLSSDSSLANFVKTTGSFMVEGTSSATSAGIGSLTTAGGLFVGGNAIVSSTALFNAPVNFSNVVTIGNAAVPIKIVPSSTTDGTGISFAGVWDVTGGYTIGRGSPSLYGGRALTFTVPTMQSYGLGHNPGFVFESSRGDVYLTLDNTGLQLPSGNLYIASTDAAALTVMGGTTVGSISCAGNLSAANGSFVATTTDVQVNPGLSLKNRLSVLGVSANGTSTYNMFTVDANNGVISYLPASFSGAVTMSSTLVVSGAFTANNGILVQSGILDVNNNAIVNLRTPQVDGDPATKGYVDSVAQGFSTKLAVGAASTGNLDLTVPLTTLDDVSVTPGTRVLIKNQTDPKQNGIYVLRPDNVPNRSSDMPVDSSKNVAGSSVFVVAGTRNGTTGFVVVGPRAIVGTDPITWTPYTGTSGLSVGGGLSLLNGQFSVNVDNYSIGIAAAGNSTGNLRVLPSLFSTGLVASTGTPVTTSTNQSHVTQIGTITTGTWNASVIQTAYGGTGRTSFTSGQLLIGNGTGSLQTTTDVYVDGTSKYVGFQNTSPSSNLHITNPTGNATGVTIRLQDTAPLTSQSSGLYVTSALYSSRFSLLADGTLYLGQEDTSGASRMVFATQRLQRMMLDSAGNLVVGPIGSTAFTGQKVSIYGQTSVTDTFTIRSGNLVTPTLTISAQGSGTILTSPSITVAGTFATTSDVTSGNVKLVSSVTGETSLLSTDNTTGLALPLRLRTTATGTASATALNNRFVVHGILQIGGSEADTTSGFSLQTVGGNLTINPGRAGSPVLFNAPISFGAGLNLYDQAKPNDPITFRVASNIMYLQAAATTTTNPFGFQTGGGGTSEVIVNFMNKGRTSSVSYDPTNVTEYPGGVFAVSSGVLNTFGEEVRLSSILRFDSANSIEGVLGNLGWYYLGPLGTGRTTITASLSWRVRIDYDGISTYSSSQIVYDRNVVDLVIFKDASQKYQLFIHVLAAPCRISILEAPNRMYPNTYFEGGGATPTGTYSHFSSWTTDFSLIQAQSNASLEFGSLSILSTATMNNVTLTGQTNIRGQISFTALNSQVPTTFYGSSHIFYDPATSAQTFSLLEASSDKSPIFTVYGSNTQSPTISFNRQRCSANVSMLPDSASMYPGGLVITHTNNDTSSYIVLSTRNTPALVIDDQQNVTISSTMDNISTGIVSLHARGGAIFDKRVQFNGPTYSSNFNILDSTTGSSANVTFSSGVVNFGGSRVGNLADPVNARDAVTMGFVENLIQGLSVKESVIAASDNVNVNLANPLTVLDGVSIRSGNQVLLKNQTNPVENGIYDVGSTHMLTRSADMAVGSSAAASFVFVGLGTQNANTGWICSTPQGQDVVGVNSLSFTQFSGAGQFNAGPGLAKIGNTIQVLVDGSSLEIINNILRVSSGIAGTGLTGGSGSPLAVSSISHLSVLGTITTGSWQASPIGLNFGGTGATGFAVGRIPYSNGVSLTQGLLFFDDMNVRLGINTLTPTAGLTVQDRDIQVTQTTGTSSVMMLSNTVTNSSFAMRNDPSGGFVISGGTGTNKASLTDLSSLDGTGNLTIGGSLMGTAAIYGASLRYSSNRVEKLTSGALSINYFSSDNTGSFLNFYGALGTSASTTNSEYMRVGYSSSQYILQTGATGTGTARSLVLQSSVNTNQLVLLPTGGITANAPITITSTLDATSTTAGGALTIAGGLSVASKIYATRAIISGSGAPDAINLPDGGITALTHTVTSTAGNTLISASSATGYLSISPTSTQRDSICQISSFDANNSYNVQMRLFGFGKSSTTTTAEWLQVGYESSTTSYAIRTQQGGAATLRPLVLSASTTQNQLVLNTDGSVTIAGNLDARSLVSYTNTLDATSTTLASVVLSGGLAVAKSVIAGTLINSPTLQITDHVEFSASGSLDTVFMRYVSTGQLNLYNNSNTLLNIHSGNSAGPLSANQEKLVLGYYDATAHLIGTDRSGTGSAKDLLIRTTSAYGNQLRLYASDGSVRIGTSLQVTGTADAATDGSAGAAIISGGLYVAKSVISNGTFTAGAGTVGTLFSLRGLSRWSFNSIDSSTMMLSSSGANSTFQIGNTSGTALASFDTASLLLTFSGATTVSSTNAKALDITDSSGTDQFVFNTVSHYLDMCSGRVSNLGQPQVSTDAATKAYVDNLIKGLNLKAAVHAASNSNVDLLSPVNSIDGVTLVPGYRVLLMAQTNMVENGIYDVGSAKYLTRSSDFAVGSHAAGAFAFVEMGTVRGDKGYVCITDYPNDLVGSNSLSFTQFNGNVISAGLGLFKDGNNVMNISLDVASGLSFNGTSLRIDPSFAGSGLTYSNGTISVSPITQVSTIISGTWQGGVIQPAFGGTGNNSYNTSGILFVSNSGAFSTAANNSFTYDQAKVGVGINSIADPNNQGDGLTLKSKDILLNGTGTRLSWSNNNLEYTWSVRHDVASPLSALSSLGIKSWSNIIMSNDGTTILVFAGPGSPGYISRDYGLSWNMIFNDEGTHIWQEPSISNDGSVIVLTASESYVYTSTNGGQTFATRLTDDTREWEYSSMSSNGQYILVSSYVGGLFASSNSSSTFTLVSNVPTDTDDLGFVHVMKDGHVQFAGYWGGPVMVSRNYGATFTADPNLPSANWWDIAEASTANFMILYAAPGYLWTSTDTGLTWTQRMTDAPRNWTTVSLSASAETIIAGEEGGYLYISRDYGVTWTPCMTDANRFWTFVKASPDGSLLYAGGQNIPVYISSNYGATWSAITSGNADSANASINSQGNLFFTNYNGYVYRYAQNPATALAVSCGKSATKTGLNDFIWLLDRNMLGINYNSSTSNMISNTLDINGTLRATGVVSFDKALSVASGGTGSASFSKGVLLANGSEPLTSLVLADGAVPIGNSSGSVVAESGDTLRAHLGLAIGSQVQAWAQPLADISLLSPTAGQFIMGNGSNFVMATPQSAGSSMGLGSLAYLNTINNTNWSGAQLTVANGGTGNTTFTTGNLTYYNGSIMTSIPGVAWDNTNSGLAIGSTNTTISGSGMTMYGQDLSLVTSSDTVAQSIMFHKADSTVLWRLRKAIDNTFILSGGTSSVNKSSLVDRMIVSTVGDVLITSTTDSGTGSSGALSVTGGLYVGKNVTMGAGLLSVANTTDSGSIGTGSVVLAGGLSVAKNATVASLTAAGSSIAAYSGGTFITLPTTGPSGIGVGTAGTKFFGAYVSSNNLFFTGSSVGDFATLNSGKIMWGRTSGSAPDMILSGGSLGIGTATPGVALDVVGSIRCSSIMTVTNGTASVGTGSGALVVTGGVGIGGTINSASIATGTGTFTSGSNLVSLSNASVATGGLHMSWNQRSVGSYAAEFVNNIGAGTGGGFNFITTSGTGSTTTTAASISQGGDVTATGKLIASSTVDSVSSTSSASGTFAGGISVAKTAYIGGNLVVSGLMTNPGAVVQETLTTNAGDYVNITGLTVYSAKTVRVNTQRMLTVTFQVTPTAGSLNTQFSFNLPGRVTNLATRLDLDTAQASGYTDDVNLVVLQNVLCTGVTGSVKALVKFQSVSTALHYLQVFVSYVAV